MLVRSTQSNPGDALHWDYTVRDMPLNHSASTGWAIPTCRCALVPAIIDGSILTVINQVDAVFGQAELVIRLALLSTAAPFIVLLSSVDLAQEQKETAGRANPSPAGRGDTDTRSEGPVYFEIG